MKKKNILGMYAKNIDRQMDQLHKQKEQQDTSMYLELKCALYKKIVIMFKQKIMESVHSQQIGSMARLL
jgi:hypothetical protein